MGDRIDMRHKAFEWWLNLIKESYHRMPSDAECDAFKCGFKYGWKAKGHSMNIQLNRLSKSSEKEGAKR